MYIQHRTSISILNNPINPISNTYHQNLHFPTPSNNYILSPFAWSSSPILFTFCIFPGTHWVYDFEFFRNDLMYCVFCHCIICLFFLFSLVRWWLLAETCNNISIYQPLETLFCVILSCICLEDQVTADYNKTYHCFYLWLLMIMDRSLLIMKKICRMEQHLFKQPCSQN